jgi:maleate cis-trans isomerase
MGAKRVAIASYYGVELNDAIVRYLAHFGLDGVPMGGYGSGADGEALYTTSLSTLDSVSFREVYRYCKEGFLALGDSVDALYINGAGWEAAPAISYLERDLDTTVIYGLSAELWATYAAVTIRNPVEGLGALLSGRYAVPSLD